MRFPTIPLDVRMKNQDIGAGNWIYDTRTHRVTLVRVRGNSGDISQSGGGEPGVSRNDPAPTPTY